MGLMKEEEPYISEAKLSPVCSSEISEGVRHLVHHLLEKRELFVLLIIKMLYYCSKITKYTSLI